jgi:hypothetical protein
MPSQLNIYTLERDAVMTSNANTLLLTLALLETLMMLIVAEVENANPSRQVTTVIPLVVNNVTTTMPTVVEPSSAPNTLRREVLAI